MIFRAFHWWRLGALLLPLIAAAQVDLQKESIDSVVLKFVTNKPSTNRCLLWYPFDSTRKPLTEFDENGNAFTRVKLRAHVRGKDCNVSFRPQESMKLVKTEENELFFEVIVRPPTTVIDFNGFFNGPDFRDQLIFEATSDSLEEVDFFTFFKKSKVYFEARYAKFETNNKNQKLSMLPVFGGKIGVPFPWIDRLILDFSMFQNLGNLTPNNNVRAQYSDFSFGMNYMWSGKESWGRPQLIPAVEFKGKNFYQTWVENRPSSEGGKLFGVKPFLVGQANSPRAGLDASWFPGAAIYPWEHWLARVGIDTSFRYAFGAKIPITLSTGSTVTRGLTSWMLDTGLQYRLTRKWALGAGYSMSRDSFVYPISNNLTKQNNNNIYLRLILVPYIVEDAE